MKLLPALAGALFLLSPSVFAETTEERDLQAEFAGHTGSFVLYDAKKDHWLRYQPAACEKRTSPCSTFKVPNSLIFLETGVVAGPDVKVSWDGVKRSIPEWNQDQTLRSAIAVSCVWYYQVFAAKVGAERYEKLLPAFGYGNHDISGGVTEFWLESSLKISPNEQVQFLRRLHEHRLPTLPKNIDTVLDIMKLGERGDRVFRGKTGTAGNLKTGKFTLGWFVGSVTTPDGNYYFATRLTDGENPSGKVARKVTEAVLAKLGVLPAEAK